MSNSLLQMLYDASPALIQTLMLNMYAGGVHKERYGKAFLKIAKELEKRQPGRHLRATREWKRVGSL